MEAITLPTIIESDEQLDNALATKGELQGIVITANADLDQALQAVRDTFAPRFTLPVGEKDSQGKHAPVNISEINENLDGLIERYCSKNKRRLLKGDAKSVKLLHGVIGWKKKRDALATLLLNEEEAKALKEKGLLAKCLTLLQAACKALTLLLGKSPISSFVAVSVAWDKSALLDAYKQKLLTKAQLVKQGLEPVLGEDEFYCEYKSEKRTP